MNFCRFRAGIKDLEVMMTNVISSAFDTVTTVEQGVELLDIFMHLSTREVRLHLVENQIKQISVGYGIKHVFIHTGHQKNHDSKNVEVIVMLYFINLVMLI